MYIYIVYITLIMTVNRFNSGNMAWNNLYLIPIILGAILIIFSFVIIGVKIRKRSLKRSRNPPIKISDDMKYSLKIPSLQGHPLARRGSVTSRDSRRGSMTDDRSAMEFNKGRLDELTGNVLTTNQKLRVAKQKESDAQHKMAEGPKRVSTYKDLKKKRIELEEQYRSEKAIQKAYTDNLRAQKANNKK